jgi:hypothetical protein
MSDTTTTPAKRVRKAPKKAAGTKTRKPAKSTAKKAPAKKAPAKPAKSTRKSSSEPRRGRGGLATDVLEVIERFVAGKVKLDEGKTLTPHRIALEIQKSDKLDAAPSAGAVTNVVKDMQEIGFITTHAKPLAVKAISAAGQKEGYHPLKAKANERKAKAKK